jgi:ATP-binding protein involved in chromosome partitioning
MADLDDFSNSVAAVAGTRASGLKAADGVVSLMLDVSGMAGPERAHIEAEVRSALEKAGAQSVRVMLTAERIAPRLIAVASGKGGVGKSTLSTNLAVAMARAGRAVGLVDADIYGPSQSRLMGAEGIKPKAEGKLLIPVIGAGDVPFLSMGQLVNPGQAIAWRGPMAGNALSQLVDAQWGEARDIIVDLPPGTGDIQLSMIQKHKPVGAVIISTPQDLALIDAARAISFFDTAKVPIIGLVENMAGYLCPHCGEMSDPFGSGGAEAAAAELGIPFLGRIPLDIEIRRASDAGEPPALGEGPISEAYAAIARRVASWVDNQKANAA